MNGIESIAAERKRQVEAEGWTPDHDDEHTRGEMAKAAGCYAWVAAQSNTLRLSFITPPPTWPEEWGAEWWKPKDRRRDLVRAGALIAAEIDRLDRAEKARINAEPCGECRLQPGETCDICGRTNQSS